jgi:predicted transcriptional regulator
MFGYVFILHLCLKFCLLQKASASSAAVVSDYIGYLEKGQIPPKVH